MRLIAWGTEGNNFLRADSRDRTDSIPTWKDGAPPFMRYLLLYTQMDSNLYPILGRDFKSLVSTSFTIPAKAHLVRFELTCHYALGSKASVSTNSTISAYSLLTRIQTLISWSVVRNFIQLNYKKIGVWWNSTPYPPDSQSRTLR